MEGDMDGMGPDEFRDAVGQLGESIAGAGRCLGVNPKTPRDWANPEGDGPSPPVARILRYLLANRITLAEFEKTAAAWRHMREFGEAGHGRNGA